MPEFMPIRRVPGPLQITTGPTGIVVASRPCMLNSSLQTASTAVITQGRYSGLQPAITAAIATFSTVTSTRSGGTVATTSSAARLVPSNIANTRASVGGTTGSPSVQLRVNIISMSSSASATSIRRERRMLPPCRARSSSTRSGSTLLEPQPGRITGSPSPSSSMPVNSRQAACDHPKVRSVSMPSTTRISVGTVSMSWCQLTARSSSWMATGSAGKSGSSWVYTVMPGPPASCRSTGTTVRHVSQSRFTTATRPSGSCGFSMT